MSSDDDTSVAGSSANQPDDLMQPKLLKTPQKYPRLIPQAASLVAVGLSTVAVLGVTRIMSGLLPSTATFELDCAAQRASNIERFFLIDIRIGSHLSYAAAKTLDFSFDILVGQVGRLLHGWILYRAIMNVLTNIAERRAIPFHFALNISFAGESLEGLWSATRLIYAKESYLMTLIAVWVLISSLYVIIFPTIWNASSGYMPSSNKTWELMPGIFVPVDSDSLHVCWIGNFDRLTPGHAGFVLGPRYYDIATNDPDAPRQSSAAANLFQQTWTPQLARQNSTGYGSIHAASKYVQSASVSAEFSDIYAYTATQMSFEAIADGRTLKQPENGSSGDYMNWLSTTTDEMWINTSGAGPENVDDPDANKDLNVLISSDGTFYPDGNDYVSPLDFPTRRVWPFDVWPSRIDGWQHGTGERMERGNLSSLVPWLAETRRGRPGDVNMTSVLDVDIGIFNTTFVLGDQSNSNTGLIPYNSTLWWNDTWVELEAPFLDLRHTPDGRTCEWFSKSKGILCLCLDEKPLTDDIVYYLTDDFNPQPFCLSRSDYVWGFASYMTGVAILLELLWLMGCFSGWLTARHKSRLLRHGRPMTGFMRSALDIANAAQMALGPDTGAHTEAELMEKLDQCSPVGFVVMEPEATKVGLKRIRMEPLPGGIRGRRGMDLSDVAVYG